MRLLLTVLVCLAALAPPATAGTIYVDGVNGNDTWSGLCETWQGGDCGPKATISAGVAIAADGDLVLLADAVYAGSANRNINYTGRAITVRSANGPAECIVDCEDSEDPAFHFASGETAFSILDGVMVKNCYGC